MNRSVTHRTNHISYVVKAFTYEVQIDHLGILWRPFPWEQIHWKLLGLSDYPIRVVNPEANDAQVLAKCCLSVHAFLSEILQAT